MSQQENRVKIPEYGTVPNHEFVRIAEAYARAERAAAIARAIHSTGTYIKKAFCRIRGIRS